MSALITRAQLTRSPAYVTWNGHTFESREKLDLRCAPKWDTVMTSMFGAVDVAKTDFVGKFMIRLWGAWENLSDIFPSYLLNYYRGISAFGVTDKPLVIQARNNDLVTIKNAAVTGMPALYLGVDNDLFAADLEFTYLIASGSNPEDAGAYTVRGTNAYDAAAENFSKANYKRTRFSGAWGAIAGFTSIVPQKGVAISWNAKIEPVPCDGYGTMDMSVDDLIVQAKCIPIGPTAAQLKTASQEEAAMGTLGSTINADLTWAGAIGSPIVTLKSAYLKENGLVFDSKELRIGEAVWETTRGFAGGAAAPVASVA